MKKFIKSTLLVIGATLVTLLFMNLFLNAWDNTMTDEEIVYYLEQYPTEEKLIQEIRPFRKIDDSFKKIVVTKDIVPTHYDEHGILTMNIYDFLLNPQAIENGFLKFLCGLLN